MEETHVCEKCCAEFFDQSEFLEHKKNCTKNAPVLILREGDSEGPPQVFSEAPPESVNAEQVKSKAEREGPAKGSAEKMDRKVDSANKSAPQPAPKTNGFGYLPKTTASNTNVTLQTINTTKVAVNQHASNGISNPANNPNTIPMILEQLVCLQQQQLQQIQLTEQIRIQIAMMAPNSLHPSIAAATDPLKALGAHLSQQLTAAVALIGQKAGTQNLTLETLKQSKLPHSTIPVVASGTVPITLSSPLIKPEVINRGIPPSVSRFPNPVLPRSPGTVIFQNPLSVTDAAKKLKSKFPGVAISEGKPNGEDQFFRHKCKFCGKAFGNDSALQIHLRSHTGERPYKCNICGNRFTTKGNLKVHFQRHREKYPHIRMNPYPVPEHLDNIPTTTGIPYGMSVPLDESNVIIDTKPGVPSLPSSGLHMAGVADSSVIPLPINLQSKPSPGSEGESVSSGVVGHESGTDQSLNSPSASGSSEQGSETSKLQQLVENIDKSGSDLNECQVCHRILSCPSSLKMHYRTHTGERPFKCKICGRAFSTKSNLKTHYGVHRANTPSKVQHSCPICQKKFTNAVVLQQHIRMHMGGQIPNTPVPEDSCEDNDSSVNDEKNGDLNSFMDDNIDDIDMEEDSELGDGPLGDGPLGSKPPTPQSVVPVESPAQLSEPMSQDNHTSPALKLERQNSVKSIGNGSVESDGLTNDSSSTGDQEYPKSPTQSETRGVSPTNSQGDSPPSKSPPSFNGHDLLRVSSKAERSEHGSVDAEGDGALDLTNGNLIRKIKEEPGLPHNGDFSRSSNVYISPPPTLIKVEMPTDRVIGMTHFITPPTLSPGMTPLIAPQRRSAKQHLCPTCNKNFSSASALQIHERTHTGEKPFACTICGRAFTTKGNLKVHVGTHMWNNSARRGRRLSMDNQMPPLGNDTMKVAEIFPKYLVPSAVNIDPAVWSQYATALNNGLAMKTNEISVIQSGGIPSLPVSNGSAPIVSTATVSNLEVAQPNASQSVTEMEEKPAESAPKHPFPHFMEENIAVK
ncbi:hypothetical protein GDO78_004795 [Eleutherodactylus coqui]|uniref:Homeotic protein spalt-major n=2 Tax=Eleutherodactylus coqui TaxID=57060 RepID=A0A8J6ET48_ELECQ|nr:hypothetical protein GDO78_004795 [Eleutherodactylus coqui]